MFGTNAATSLHRALVGVAPRGFARAGAVGVLAVWCAASACSDGAGGGDSTGDSAGPTDSEGDEDTAADIEGTADSASDAESEGDAAASDAADGTAPPDSGSPTDAVEPPRDIDDDAGQGNEDVADDARGPSICGGCDAGWAPPTESGILPEGSLLEVSGIASSRRNPDVLWMHNDGGNKFALVALSPAGKVLGSLVPQGLSLDDPEDLALADCPDGGGDPCLWVADIGDNTAKRSTVTVYAMPEPALPDNAGESLTPENVWVFPLRYEDGPRDSEAIAVAPGGDALWLFEKLDAPQAGVYALAGPLVPNKVGLLERAATIDSPGLDISKGRMITGASLSPCGTLLALRTYTGTWDYTLETPEDVGKLDTFAPSLVAWGPLTEGQGEAVAHDAYRPLLWTVSEQPKGRGAQPIHRYECSPE
jgi:hypothetical protein